MKTWTQIPAKTRLEAELLVASAKEVQLRSLPVKSDGKYFSLVLGSLEEKNELLKNFSNPIIPKDYKEDEAEDLNLLLNEMKGLEEENERRYFAYLLRDEIKRLTDKKKIVRAVTEDGTSYIRRVGILVGSSTKNMVLQFTGDYQGMVVWNSLPLEKIEKLVV